MTYAEDRRYMVVKASPIPGCGFRWMDMLRTGEKLLRAGLRRELGPEGDVDAAYRDWYRRQMDEHDELVAKLCERFYEAGEDASHAT
jgi:hypothetical protein